MAVAHLLGAALVAGLGLPALAQGAAEAPPAEAAPAEEAPPVDDAEETAADEPPQGETTDEAAQPPATAEPPAEAPPVEGDLTAAPEEDLTAAPEEDLTAASGDEGDDSFLDLDATQSDEPTLLERQIVALVASGVTVAALAVGATFGVLAYMQYQCVANVVQCNEGAADPIVGDELFDARANVEQLALLADMAYLFAAASALVAITGFIRGFFWTGEDDAAPPADVIEPAPTEPPPAPAAEPAGEPGGEAPPPEGAPSEPEAVEPAPADEAPPAEGGETPPAPPTTARTFPLGGSLHFEVE